MDPLNMVYRCIWAIAMILVNDPFDQSCRAQISSTCFICSRVIIQKLVFRILQGYSIFLIMSFRVSNASMQKFLIIGPLDSCSVLSEFSLPRIFWSILGELLCMQHIRNSTADSLSRTISCHAGFYIILWISALRICMDFINFGSQSDWSIIDYLTKSAHFILFRMG